MKIIGTGLSGLVGTRVVALLSKDFHFDDLSLETGIDVTNKAQVLQVIAGSDAPWVLHFAARTDVDGIEKERSQGVESSAWKVNVLGTQNVVDACKTAKKHLVYISTDYVFDGKQASYTEDDTPNPQSWYAVTKYEGEKRISELGDMGIIIRIANPYCARPVGKVDFVHKIQQLLVSGQSLKAPNDQIFVPTLIDDIAWAIATLIGKQTHGIYHVVGSESLTPFVALQKIATAFGCDPSHIAPTTFEQYFRGRAPRPFQAYLKNDKITKLGVKMSTFDQGLQMVVSDTNI